MTEDKKRSRTFELKQRLLRRAWDGDSSIAENGAEMMKIIKERLSHAADMPEDHKKMLDESRLLGHDQSRSVQMLNALAMHSGEKNRFSDTVGTHTLH